MWSRFQIEVLLETRLADRVIIKTTAPQLNAGSYALMKDGNSNHISKQVVMFLAIDTQSWTALFRAFSSHQQPLAY